MDCGGGRQVNTDGRDAPQGSPRPSMVVPRLLKALADGERFVERVAHELAARFIAARRFAVECVAL